MTAAALCGIILVPVDTASQEGGLKEAKEAYDQVMAMPHGQRNILMSQVETSASPA